MNKEGRMRRATKALQLYKEYRNKYPALSAEDALRLVGRDHFGGKAPTTIRYYIKLKYGGKQWKETK